MKKTAALLASNASIIEQSFLKTYRSSAPRCIQTRQSRKSIISNSHQPLYRSFSTDDKRPSHKKNREQELADKAKKLNEKGTEVRGENESVNSGQVDEAIGGEFQEKQARKPWHREGPETPPVDKLENPPRTLAKGMLKQSPHRQYRL